MLLSHRIFSRIRQENMFWYVIIGPFVLLSNTFKLFDFPMFRFRASPDEGYSRNALCTLRFWLILMISIYSLGSDKKTCSGMLLLIFLKMKSCSHYSNFFKTVCEKKSCRVIYSIFQTCQKRHKSRYYFSNHLSCITNTVHGYPPFFSKHSFISVKNVCQNTMITKATFLLNEV
jgi:hypothetical protein